MRNRSSGHNLLEVIIATFVFLIIVVFSSGLWTTYARSIVKSRDHLVATHLGKSVLENTVDQGFESAQSGGPFVLSMKVETDGVEQQIPYNYSIVVTTKSTGLKRIVVNVSHEFQGRVSEVSFETLLAAQ